jgi:chromosomal replication initiation ATPase DnaA
LTAAEVPGSLATGALVVEDLTASNCDERALFHLLNLAREEHAFVLLTARTPPSAEDFELRDLRSRLRAVPAVTLLPPDDALFRALIVKFCADRQIIIDESVVSYLSTRIERSFVAARQAVARLDAEALRLGRPVTRALAADLLRDGEAGGPNP